MDKYNIPVYAGVAVASFLAGNMFNYFRSKSVNDEEWKKKSNKAHFENNELDSYIISASLTEPEILVELREYTLKNVQMAKMLSDSVQVQFFRMLLKTIKAERCIEVGSYTGYNVLSNALTIPDNGVVYALDISDEFLSHGRPFFKRAGVEYKIIEMIAPANESMKQLLNKGLDGSFDFIYIDANKDGYAEYYELGLQLARSGGIIALDNMLMNGIVYDSSKIVAFEKMLKDGAGKNFPKINVPQLKDASEAIKNVTKTVKNDGRVDHSFLKIGDGLILCRKK